MLTVVSKNTRDYSNEMLGWEPIFKKKAISVKAQPETKALNEDHQLSTYYTALLAGNIFENLVHWIHIRIVG